MLITHIPEDICDIFSSHMNELQENYQSVSNENFALTRNVWWSGNLINLLDTDNHFTKSCFFIKGLAERLFHSRLYFHYLHYINYNPGGNMSFHSHERFEDYVFILYLNDCLDGETNFNLSKFVSLIPKKSQLVLFESDIEHSGSYSSSKKILVGGMRKSI